MNRKLRQLLSLFLTCVIGVQCITGCGSNGDDSAPKSSRVLITEDKIEESFIYEQNVDEEYYTESFLAENLIFEDNTYECVVDENIISEGYYFEMTVTENVIEDVRKQLPEELEDYDIDWPAVIAKFSVGTIIIIATGVVYSHFPSTYYVIASPVEVGRDAVIGGAIAASINVGTQEIKAGGNLPEEAIKKYAVEGFADGYMWGAITSVLRCVSKNIKRPSSLVSETGDKLKIAWSGAVLDATGNVVGKAYYAKDGIYILKEAVGVTAVEIFDMAGKQVVDATAEQLAAIAAKRLPVNAVLSLGDGAARQICRTDAEGVIYSINGELLKNTTYRLGNAVYKTDTLGRIAKVTFDSLELKDSSRARRIIANSINEIGKGYEVAGDQRGHIIADRFNGNNTLANMVAMSAEANQGQYAAIEDIWADALEKGQNVSGSITFSYTEQSFRPDNFKVVYDIGEGLVTKIIVN